MKPVPAVVLALAAAPLAAQESGESGRAPELVQEAFRAELVYPQARRELQGTVAFDHQRDPGFRLWEAGLLLEFGITDRFQVSGGVPLRSRRVAPGDTETGMGRPEVGLLLATRPSLNPFALSFEVEAGLPSPDGDEAGVEWGGTMIGAVRLGVAQLHASAGVEIEDGEVVPGGGAVAIYPVGAWRLLLEASGVRDGATVAWVTPGVAWRIVDDLELAVGVPIPLTAAAPGTNLVVKLTLEAEL